MYHHCVASKVIMSAADPSPSPSVDDAASTAATAAAAAPSPSPSVDAAASTVDTAAVPHKPPAVDPADVCLAPTDFAANDRVKVGIFLFYFFNVLSR
jgi:hypothetical protein